MIFRFNWLALSIAGCLYCSSVQVSAANGDGDTGSAAFDAEDFRQNHVFGTIRSWQNRVPAKRLPHLEKTLTTGAQQTPIPPRSRREGLIPRFGIAGKYNDNIFFSPGIEVDDFITVISPGLSYTRSSDRWNLDFDYSLASTFYSENTQLNKTVDSQTAKLLYNYHISPVTELFVVNYFEVSRDPFQTLLLGSRPELSSITYNHLSPQLIHKPTPDMDISLRYINRLSLVDQADASDIYANGISGTFMKSIDQSTRLGATYEASLFDFSNVSDETETTHSGTFDFEHDIDERFIIKGKLGVMGTSADSGHTYGRFNTSADFSGRNSVFLLQFDRDIDYSAGFNQLLLRNSLSSSAKFRVRKGVQWGTQVSLATLETISGAGSKENSLEADAWLTYAIHEDLWFKLEYLFRKAKPDDGDKTKNNIVGLYLTAEF